MECKACLDHIESTKLALPEYALARQALHSSIVINRTLC